MECRGGTVSGVLLERAVGIAGKTMKMRMDGVCFKG